MKKHRGLGRGLDVLIPVNEEPEQENKNDESSNEVLAHKQRTSGADKKEATASSYNDLDGLPAAKVDKQEENLVTMVRLTKVEPNRNQPRKSFDPEKLQELSDSIKNKGLLEPIIVQDFKDHYEIIAGERRWRACKLAGLKEIPVIIKDYEDRERVEISLIENIQRENLNPIEEANAYRRLIDEFHLKQDELAERVSKNRSSIANSMRLLKLPSKVQEMVIEGLLSMGHARALLAIEDEEIQIALAQEIVEKKLSVRETERAIQLLSRKKTEKKEEKDPSLQLIYKDLASKMNAALGMKVSIKDKGKKRGSIEISFENQEDLEKIMDKIM